MSLHQTLVVTELAAMGAAARSDHRDFIAYIQINIDKIPRRDWQVIKVLDKGTAFVDIDLSFFLETKSPYFREVRIVFSKVLHEFLKGIFTRTYDNKINIILIQYLFRKNTRVYSSPHSLYAPCFCCPGDHNSVIYYRARQHGDTDQVRFEIVQI